ncbi:glycosyltransferase [Thioalkalivibrio paradoxus]|uniref:glycosyltransferase n=1 Tax=Thioalkalivibrio paradoxus TaxID=108010 RepID=UPI000314F180|nr:glycosyltransferase [Thioalkalivibrio paradoxus]
MNWLADLLQEHDAARIHLCPDAPLAMRASVIEAARRARTGLWLCSGTTPLATVTHGLGDPSLLQRKREIASILPAGERERIEALQRFYGIELALDTAEGYHQLDSEALHQRSAETWLPPPTGAGREGSWPLVSVIIRSMDRRSLGDALDSVACQTYPRIEAVVVNAKGGEHSHPSSKRPDLSVRLINDGGRSLPRAAAANTGLEAAQGRFALFLDDDDLLYPSHLETLYRALNASPGSVAAYSGIRVEHYDPAGQVIQVAELNETFDRRRLLIQNFLPIHAVLFDREQVAAAGCRFDEALGVYEDWDFWLQISALSEFAHMPEVTAVYRNFGGSGLGLEIREVSATQNRDRLRKKWRTAGGELLDAALDYAADENNPWIRTWRQQCQSQQEEQRQRLAAAEQRIQTLQTRPDQIEAIKFKETVRLHQDAAAAARAEITVLENHLRYIRESTSWRITRPLRILRILTRESGKVGRGILQLARDHGGWGALASRATRSFRRYGVRVTLGRALTHLGVAQRFAQADGALGHTQFAAHIEHAPPPPIAPLVLEHAPVDIIVCVHNALEDVQRCLGSVVSHTSPPYRLILVDDGSEAATRDYLSEFAQRHDCLRLRNEAAKGYTLAANMGLRASSAPYVVLLNSDTVVSSEWLPRLLRCADSDPAIAMAGPLSNTASWQSIPRVEEAGDWATNPLPQGWDASDMAQAVAGCGAPVFPRLPFLNGFCLLIKREVIEQFGVFDEENFARGYGEENDYSLRLYEGGWSLAVADDVYVFHAQSRSYSNERRKRLGELAAQALARKHGQALIDRLAMRCRHSRVMAGIRARSTVCPDRIRLRREGRERFAGKRVLFLLPAADAGGGANIIVSEAQRMLDMGVDAAIANLAANRQDFERAYQGLRLPVHYFRRPEELETLAHGFDAVVASIYYTVAWLRPLSGRGPVLGYYVQDFEPHWFSAGSREHREAMDSYTLLPGLRPFCKTEWNRSEVQQHTGAECRVLGPSVEVDLFRPRHERVDGRIVIAGMVRPYSSYRSPAMTMRILNQIKSAHPDEVEIVTFGVDEFDPSFQNLRPTAPTQHLGRLGSPELATVFDQVDIFVDFSTYQAMGLTAMEAMACGAAVIVPAAGGTTDFARHEHNALVVDTRDEAQCQSALERLVRDATLRQRLGQQALTDIQQFHPEGAALRMLSALFD